jgi:hypothetical protein
MQRKNLALVAAISAVSLASAVQAQAYRLQRSTSLSLASVFASENTLGFGTNPLSVAFDGTNAYVGGFNGTGGFDVSVGVLRVDNVLGEPAFTTLDNTRFNAGAQRGIDSVAAAGGNVFAAYDDGSGGSAFVRSFDSSGNTRWNVDGISLNGYRASALAIDPLGNGGSPALGALGISSGRRVAFNLDDGSLIYGPSGVSGSSGLGEIINPNPAAVNGVTLGFTYRGLAFDSAGNVAVTGQGGTSYANRDTVGGTNFNRVVNLDNITSASTPIAVKQLSSGSAGFVGQGLDFVEGLSESILAINHRVGTPFELSHSSAAAGVGPITALDSRQVQLRRTDGSLPTALLSSTITGAEDGLTDAFTNEVKDIASGRDANGNPIVLVLSFAERRLDVYTLEPEWNVNAAGTWGTNSNWLVGVPDSNVSNARFGSAITSDATVTLDGPRTTKYLKFDNASASYRIEGTDAIQLDAQGAAALPVYIEAIAGEHEIAAPVTLVDNGRFIVQSGARLTISGDVAGSGRGLTKRGAGDLEMKNIRVSALALDEGVTRILAGNTIENSISRIAGLSLNGGTLDLADSGLIFEYTDTSPLADFQQAINLGLVFSSLQTSSSQIVPLEASLLAVTSFAGIAVDDTAVIVRHVLKGDTDLSGTVGFEDLLALAQNYNPEGSGTTWVTGDFDGNGVTDFNDLLVLAQNYNQNLLVAQGNTAGSLSPAFAADFARVVAVIPEPATLGLIAGLSLLAARRR